MKRVFIFSMLGLLLLSSSIFAQTLSDAVSSRRHRLETELGKVEKEISTFQALIESKQKEAISFKRDIAIFDAQINKTRLEMKSLALLVERLSGQIHEKETSILNVGKTIDSQRKSLAETLKKLREYDNFSLVEVVLSYNRLSDFFGDIDAIDIVQSSLQQKFDDLRSFRKEEETLRDEFITEKRGQIEARALLAIEKRGLEKKEKKRQELLKATKGEEARYQKFVASRKKDAASIRSQLFLLEGSPSISFGKAVLFAERASQKTGVRVAFILGIIAQESELGRNIGRCNMPDDPPKYKWRAIMKPSRDRQPYLDITSRLGLDPDLMPLSCPLSVGWGGAMGPAQFIPSTWVLFENRIARATGHNPPSPWEPEDAFMASALFLSDLGANHQGGEREAAGRYFAGKRWNGSLGRRYASQVLAKVAIYQEQIDILSGQ